LRPVAVAVHPGGRVKTDGQLRVAPSWAEP
jgi:hypothetical protein